MLLLRNAIFRYKKVPAGMLLLRNVIPMPTAVPAAVPACAFLSRRIGTPPATVVPKNIEIQGGTLPIFCFESCSKSRNEHSASISSKNRQFFCDFGGYFGDFGCPGTHLDPKRAQGPKNARF